MFFSGYKEKDVKVDGRLFIRGLGPVGGGEESAVGKWENQLHCVHE